jgi:branched-chain amino acid transport system substrate-binding protein
MATRALTSAFVPTLVATGALATLAAACTGGNDEPARSAPAVATAGDATTVAPRVDDGVLRLGVLLPATGPGQQLGEDMSAAVDAAIAEINAAGGVLGEAVVAVRADEGADQGTASEGVGVLVEQDVDAVIGPSSSLTTLATLADLVAADVLTCSPTASALSLDSFPDRGLFVRTISSDSLEAEAIALTAEQTGARSVAIGYLDDSFGRPFARAVEAALRARNLQVFRAVGFSAGDELLEARAGEIVESQPDVIVVIADADEGGRLLGALGELVPPSAPAVIVNDAVRTASPQVISSLPDRLRTQLVGLAPIVSVDEGESPSGLFASYARDCVLLVALAAVQAGSTNAVDVAGQIAGVSSGGSQCSSFAQCRLLVEQGRNVDYNGALSLTEIGANGDTARARFDTFRWDKTGRDVTGERTAVVSVR